MTGSPWSTYARKITRTATRSVVRRADADLASALSVFRGRFRSELDHRVGLVLDTLGARGGDDLVSRTAELSRVLRDDDPQAFWLTLAVVHGALPVEDHVTDFRRRHRLDGPAAIVEEFSASIPADVSVSRRPAVRVVRGEVLVDLHHTSRTELATGIQRVARQTSARWAAEHPIVVVGWDDDLVSLRELDPAARAQALGHPPVSALPTVPATVLIPWECTYVVPELMTEPPRTDRLRALARFSRNRTGVIGFDCVPITTAETTVDAMGSAFARLMAAVRHVDVVVAISEAAANEHLGWVDMLASAGSDRPEVVAVSLPVESQDPDEGMIEEARLRFADGDRPIVLCVGSHEPRKNHLAILHAAERLWRADRSFTLLFVGGNSWRSEAFTRRLDELRGAGRSIATVTGLDDDLLWAAYRLATVVVFPSLNEGYGLPVAEALASGTPVITSEYGSMAEIASHGGALLVDPRDDDAVERAIDLMLSDPDTRSRLAAEAAAVPTSTWDTYAAAVWTAIHDRPGTGS